MACSQFRRFDSAEHRKCGSRRYDGKTYLWRTGITLSLDFVLVRVDNKCIGECFTLPRSAFFSMHALHQTLLPASAIHHSLYLANFTPSTIYPLPQPNNVDLTTNLNEIKVTGNLIVAGGQDLRIFEIREEVILIQEKQEVNGNGNGFVENGEEKPMEEDFFDNGPTQVRNTPACIMIALRECLCFTDEAAEGTRAIRDKKTTVFAMSTSTSWTYHRFGSTANVGKQCGRAG